MSARKINNISLEIFLLTSVLLILLLSALNIEKYLAPKKVLGIETQSNSTSEFWQSFLVKNEDYIPGWIEIGNTDKAREIDPNYF